MGSNGTKYACLAIHSKFTLFLGFSTGLIIWCQNSMTFLIPFHLESIEAATQTTLILQTLNLIVKLQQKTEKALDVPLLVRNTAQQLLGTQLVAA